MLLLTLSNAVLQSVKLLLQIIQSDKYPNTVNLFQVKITPSKRNKVEDEEAFAILAPFNPFPRVEFNSIKLNSSSTRNITLRNPSKNAIHVSNLHFKN